MNKQFELLKFVFKSVYVDLKYNEISLTFIVGSVCFYGMCSRPWFVRGVVLVPYVDVCTPVSLGCVYDERVTVTTMLVW